MAAEGNNVRRRHHHEEEKDQQQPEEPDSHRRKQSRMGEAVTQQGLSLAREIAAAAAAAPDVMMMADFVEVRETVPREQLQWELFRQDPYDPVLDDKWCLFSHFAQSKDQLQTNDVIVRLRALMDVNRGAMAPFDYCRLVQDFYNDEVREHLMDPQCVDRRKRGPVWPAENIWNYTQRVQLSPAASNQLVARGVMDTITTLLDTQWERVSKPDGTFRMEINPKVHTMLLNTLKEANKWIDRAAATANTTLV